MLAQWCLIAWNIPIGRPNCWRSFAYSVADSVAARATPEASAANNVRARARASPNAPATTPAGAASTWTRALGLDGSTLCGLTMLTPGAEASNRTRSSPHRSTSRSATAPPRTTPASPPALPPLRASSPARPTAAVTEPSVKPGSHRACCSGVPARATIADAITVGTKGPGAT